MNYTKKTTCQTENEAYAKENGITTRSASSHFCCAEEAEKIAGIWRKFIKTLRERCWV